MSGTPAAAGVACESCANEIGPADNTCPHCGRPGLYPNVRAVDGDGDALKDRAAACEPKDAAAAKRFHDFARAVESESEVVLNRSMLDVHGLATTEKRLYATYYQRIEGGLQRPNMDEWELPRQLADTALFLNYHREIRFATLSLDDRPPSPSYGNCLLVLRSDMISHRATVFEGNSAIWFKSHPHADEDSVRAHRAKWDDRGLLAATKLAEAGVFEDEYERDAYPDLLLDGDQEFVEVHIFGPMTIRTVKRVVLGKPSRDERSLVRALMERLPELGVEVVG